jgi:hypothetical protein
MLWGSRLQLDRAAVMRETPYCLRLFPPHADRSRRKRASFLYVYNIVYVFALDQSYRGIVTIDGNDKDNPDAIPHFLEALREGSDFVQASRYAAAGSRPFAVPGYICRLRTTRLSLLSCATAWLPVREIANRPVPSHGRDSQENRQFKRPIVDFGGTYKSLARYV